MNKPCGDSLNQHRYLWKSSMQWICEAASTVKGTPSRQQPQTTHVKQRGWYAFPMARRILSKIGFEHFEQRSNVL